MHPGWADRVGREGWQDVKDIDIVFYYFRLKSPIIIRIKNPPANMFNVSIFKYAKGSLT
jgi:hypothetical protein